MPVYHTIYGPCSAMQHFCNSAAIISTSLIITSGQSNLTKGRIAATHGRFSQYSPGGANVHPIHRKPKRLPWQRPLGAGYWQYLHYVGRPLKPPP